MTLVDLEQLTSDDLGHLAYLRRAREQQTAEQRVVRALDVLEGPTVGWYRRNPILGPEVTS